MFFFLIRKEEGMARPRKYGVDISVTVREIITFDFDSFAIALAKDSFGQELFVYQGTNYEQEFLQVVCACIDFSLIENVIIDPFDVEKIWKELKKWRIQGKNSYQYKQVWDLLVKVFPVQTGKYIPS